MLWSKRKRDRKNTLAFKTKKGVKRSKSPNMSSEQILLDYTEDQNTDRLESEGANNEGENING